jgi:mycothiol synthase
MRDSATIIRDYHSGDFKSLVGLEAEVHETEPTGCLISPLDLFESAGQSGHTSQNSLFIAERAGEIVGYAEARPEFNIGRIVLRWLVHPKHRRRRIAKKLIERTIARTRELGIPRIHANILQNSFMAKKLLVRMGFTLVRRFLELRLDLFKSRLQETGNNSLHYRSLQSDEGEILAQLQNRCFAGSWGYNANTPEEINDRIHLPSCSPEDIILAFDADRPIGYCWTRISPQKNKAPSENMGRIYMLGVDPDYRGRGLGRQLLLVGLSNLKSKALRVVELTVDHENEPARALYKSAGFKLWKSSLWYEKRLDSWRTPK